MNQHTGNQYLMTSDVARELGIAKQTVLLWERTGKLQAIKATNGFRLFLRSDVERLKGDRNRGVHAKKSKKANGN